MEALPLVTIVTPSYNQGAFIEATLRSVLDQDYPQIEYLVIDGGSSDQSQKIIRRYANRLAYWESTLDRGQAHAINKGLVRSHGDILGWLNSDDLLLPGTVSRAVAIFQSEPEVDVVYGRLERIDTQGRRIPTPTLPKDRLDFSGVHVIGECLVNQPGAFWRRRWLDRVGMLNEQLHYALDYEYWLRIAQAGGKFKRLTEPVAQFRLSPASKTVGSAVKMAREHLSVLDLYPPGAALAKQLGVTVPALRRQARKGRAVIDLYAFNGCLKERRPAEAFRWLILALYNDPLVLFQRRWLDLAISRLSRPGSD
jgi:glycosyltransferase involved in cell wall biosynthesis